jgi:hypothetical protein
LLAVTTLAPLSSTPLLPNIDGIEGSPPGEEFVFAAVEARAVHAVGTLLYFLATSWSAATSPEDKAASQAASAWALNLDQLIKICE